MKDVRLIDGMLCVERCEGGERLIGLTEAGARASHLRLPEGITELGPFALTPFQSPEDPLTPLEAVLFNSDAWVNRELRVLTLPRSLHTVDPTALYRCEWLSRILVEDGSPTFSSRKDALLTRDGKTLLAYPRGREAVCYLLPDGITEIADGAFRGARIEEAVLPPSLLQIGAHAFLGAALTTLHVPERVTQIGEEAFMDCEHLSRVTLPDTLVSLGERAFRNCEALLELTLPSGIKALPTFLLGGCRALSRVTLPAHLKEIGEGAFFCCDALTELTVPEGVGAIGHGAFFLCARLCLRLPAHLAGNPKDFLHVGMTEVEVY